MSHASASAGVLGVSVAEGSPDVPRRPASHDHTAAQIRQLRGDELVGWLCQVQGDEAPAIQVMGWSGLVRRLAMDCLDVAAGPAALAEAEAWLLEEGVWHFGRNGAASWRILLPDGAWAATLMTEGRSLDEARRSLSH